MLDKSVLLVFTAVLFCGLFAAFLLALGFAFLLAVALVLGLALALLLVGAIFLVGALVLCSGAFLLAVALVLGLTLALLLVGALVLCSGTFFLAIALVLGLALALLLVGAFLLAVALVLALGLAVVARGLGNASSGGLSLGAISFLVLGHCQTHAQCQHQGNNHQFLHCFCGFKWFMITLNSKSCANECSQDYLNLGANIAKNSDTATICNNNGIIVTV